MVVFTKRQGYIAVALGALLGIVSICLALYFGLGRHRKPLGEYVPHKPIPAVKITSDYPFDVNENLAFCNRMRLHVALENSTKDYYEKMTSAIKSVWSRGGGTVSMDPGVYIISKPLLLQSRVCLRGAGMLSTELRMIPNSAPYTSAGMIRVIQSERVSLIDFTLNGNRDAQPQETKKDTYGRYGLYAELTTYLWVRGVRAMKHREYGMDPHGNREKWSNYVVIEGSVADDNGKDGFTLDQSRHVALLKSSARRNARHGVNIVTGSRNVLVKDLRATYNGADSADRTGCGVIVQNNELELQTQDVKIANVSINESPRGALCISGSVNVTVANVSATITQFKGTPCFVLRKSREVKLHNTTCTAYSGTRLSNIASMLHDDNQGQVTIWRPAQRSSFDDTYIPETDPVCKYGKHYENVCCPHYCNKCGGEDCGVGGPAMSKDCCMSGILAQKRSCNVTSAPCEIEKQFLPPPAIFIDFPDAKLPEDSTEEESSEFDDDASAIPLPVNEKARSTTKEKLSKNDHRVNDKEEGHGVLKKKPIVLNVDELESTKTTKPSDRNSTSMEMNPAAPTDSIVKNKTLASPSVKVTNSPSSSSSPEKSPAVIKKVTIVKPDQSQIDELNETDEKTVEKLLVTKKNKPHHLFPFWNYDPFEQYLKIPEKYKTVKKFSPSPSATPTPKARIRSQKYTTTPSPVKIKNSSSLLPPKKKKSTKPTPSPIKLKPSPSKLMKPSSFVKSNFSSNGLMKPTPSLMSSLQIPTPTTSNNVTSMKTLSSPSKSLGPSSKAKKSVAPTNLRSIGKKVERPSQTPTAIAITVAPKKTRVSSQMTTRTHSPRADSDE